MIVAPSTSMFKTSLSINSSNSANQIVVKYNRIDDGGGCNSDFNKKFHTKLQYSSYATHLTSLSLDSSISAIKIVVKYDEVDWGRRVVGGKLVDKLSKCWKIVKKSKKPQRSGKFAKTIGSKEYLSNYQFFVSS